MYEEAYNPAVIRDSRQMSLPQGDKNVNMIVEGNVYIFQGDGVNQRGGMNYDYRQPGGQNYDYRQYQPRQVEQPNYYQYQRGACGQCDDGGYQYDPRTRYYSQRQPEQYYPQQQRSGYEYVQRGPTFSN